jgi:hypothetical protein
MICPDDATMQVIWIDGFNVLTTLEAALSGGVVLHARDGCYRDMASVHGTYRHVEETMPAIQLLGELLAEKHGGRCVWLLDQPVSNSGRLKTRLLDAARQSGWDWRCELVPNPDPILCRADGVVATSDSWVLDQAPAWLNLAKIAINSRVHDAWILALSN